MALESRHDKGAGPDLTPKIKPLECTHTPSLDCKHRWLRARGEEAPEEKALCPGAKFIHYLDLNRAYVL